MNTDPYGGCDATLIKLADGKNIMIDTGRASWSSFLIQQLKELEVTKLDYIVISHYDGDHVGGLDAISKAINVSGATVFVPQTPPLPHAFFDAGGVVRYRRLNTIGYSSNYGDYYGYRFKEIITTGEGNYATDGCYVRVGSNGERLEFCNVDHRNYYNGGAPTYNDCSLCCYFIYGSKKVFFSGDIYPDAQAFLTPGLKKVDCFKTNHHGINLDGKGNGYWLPNRAFLDKLNPGFVVTMCGANDDPSSNMYTDNSAIQNWCRSRQRKNFATMVNKGYMAFKMYPDEIVVPGHFKYLSMKPVGSEY